MGASPWALPGSGCHVTQSTPPPRSCARSTPRPGQNRNLRTRGDEIRLYNYIVNTKLQMSRVIENLKVNWGELH